MSLNKICLFSFARIYDTSMVASQRIARLIATHLKLPITTDLNIDEQPNDLDLLIIINGAYGYCRCLPKLANLVRTAKRIVWVQNDYIIIPPKPDSGAESPFRLAFRERNKAGLPYIDYWTACADNVKSPLSHYINWNALTFDDTISEKTLLERRTKSDDDLLYYGSWRLGRVIYFDRYFMEPKVKVTISSPFVKGKNKFADRYLHPNVIHRDKLNVDFYEMLGLSGLGLFLEDKTSHSEFHSPPNRFYEMLSAGLPIVFQPEAGRTMRKAGFDIDPYRISSSVIETSSSLTNLMKQKKTIYKKQRDEWFVLAQQHKSEIIPSLHAAFAKMEDSSH